MTHTWGLETETGVTGAEQRGGGGLEEVHENKEKTELVYLVMFRKNKP